MRCCWSPRLPVLMFASILIFLSITADTASSSGGNISKEVLDNLDTLYKYNKDKNWKLQKYPQPKMIALLSNNQKYRLSLENTVHSWDPFAAQVMYIIDEETAWTWRDLFNILIRPILDILEVICAILKLFLLHSEAKSNEDYVQFLEKGSKLFMKTTRK